MGGYLFGSKRKLRKVNELSIECNGHTIKAQNSVKYLGLDLGNLLTGETTVNNIVQKVNARLKFPERQCSFLDEKLGGNASKDENKENIDRLKKIQSYKIYIYKNVINTELRST